MQKELPTNELREGFGGLGEILEEKSSQRISKIHLECRQILHPLQKGKRIDPPLYFSFGKNKKLGEMSGGG